MPKNDGLEFGNFLGKNQSSMQEGLGKRFPDWKGWLQNCVQWIDQHSSTFGEGCTNIGHKGAIT